MSKKYFSKMCMNCGNLTSHDISETERIFSCCLTDDVIDVTECCDSFTISDRTKLMMEEFSGVLLTREEINKIMG